MIYKFLFNNPFVNLYSMHNMEDMMWGLANCAASSLWERRSGSEALQIMYKN